MLHMKFNTLNSVQSCTTDPSTVSTVQHNASVIVFCGVENLKIRVLQCSWVYTVFQMLMFITRLQGITSHKGQLIAQTCENIKLYYVELRRFAFRGITDGYSEHYGTGNTVS